MPTTPISDSWQDTLRRRLPRLGHRNWIVVADAAYPEQTATGIEMLLAPERIGPVLDTVLAAVRASGHVRPVIYFDRELAALPTPLAPGIDAVRAHLEGATAGLPRQPLPHEQILAKLNEVGRSFTVLLIKTRECLPYTSIFIELDCGYWSPAAEQALRSALATTASAQPPAP